MLKILNVTFPTAFSDVFKCLALSEQHNKHYHADKVKPQVLIFEKLGPANVSCFCLNEMTYDCSIIKIVAINFLLIDLTINRLIVAVLIISCNPNSVPKCSLRVISNLVQCSSAC